MRKAALDASDGTWGAALDIEAFVETGERIVFDLQKADSQFYGAVFAAKGSAQLKTVYGEVGSHIGSGAALLDLTSLAFSCSWARGE